MRRIGLASVALLALFSFAAAGAAQQTQTQTKHTAVTPVPREGGWMKRHESFNDRVERGNVDLVFIGDSITQGWEGAGKDVWQEFYGKRNAVNLGIGGDRTQHVLWRLENGNIEGISPKLAVVMIGTNNSGDNSPREIADGIEAIVATLRKELPETKILLLGIFPRGADESDPRRRVNERTNEIVSKLDDGEHVDYLDIGAEFLEDDGTLPRAIMPDLLHLSPQGYEIWARSIEASVAEQMGEQR